MPLRFILEVADESALALNSPVQKLVNQLGVVCEIHLPQPKTLTPKVATLGRDIATRQNAYFLRQTPGRVDAFGHGSIDGTIADGSVVDAAGDVIGNTISEEAYVDWLLKQPAMVEAMKSGQPFDLCFFSCHAASTKVARKVSRILGKKGFTGEMIAPDVRVSVSVDGPGIIFTNQSPLGGTMVRYKNGKVIGKDQPIIYIP